MRMIHLNHAGSGICDELIADEVAHEKYRDTKNYEGNVDMEVISWASL